MTISIITINYNNAHGLSLTIDSVLKQDYPNLQYIIIDGGSTDGSVDIIRQQANRLHYWQSVPDKGIYHAQNKGLEKATGDHILFLNSGDYFLQSDSLSALAAHAGADIVFGNILVQPNGENGWVKTYPDLPDKAYLRYDTLPHCATLIRTALLKEQDGYDERIKIGADWKFFVKMILLHNVAVQHVDKVIAVFDYDGLSSKPANRALIDMERNEVWNKYFPPPGKTQRYITKLVQKLKSRLQI